MKKKLCKPETMIYQQMRLNESSKAKSIEMAFKKIGMSEQQAEEFFSLLGTKGIQKGIPEFIKKHEKFRGEEHILELIAHTTD